MRARLLVFVLASMVLASAQAAERRSLEDYVREAFATASRLGLAPARGASLIRYERPFLTAPAGASNISVTSFIRALERAVAAGEWSTRFDAGPVAVDDPLVASRYDGPYRIGSAFVASLGWRYHLNSGTFLSLESVLRAAPAHHRFPGPPGAGLNVDNTTVHVTLGLGQQF